MAAIEIPVINADAPKPIAREVTTALTAPDPIARIFDTLDAVLALHRQFISLRSDGVFVDPAYVVLAAARIPQLEEGAMLWASINGIAVKERVSRWPSGEQVRTIALLVDESQFAVVQFPPSVPARLPESRL